jgi:hypothetical protein
MRLAGRGSLMYVGREGLGRANQNSARPAPLADVFERMDSSRMSIRAEAALQQAFESEPDRTTEFFSASWATKAWIEQAAKSGPRFQQTNSASEIGSPL